MTATEDTPLERQESLREIRASNKLRKAKLESDQIARAERQMRERSIREAWNTDWVSPWLTAMNDARGREFGFGPATMWQRRGGQSWPIYRTEQELALLRFPSRWLCATNSYCIGFVNGITGYMIGSGLTYRVILKDKDDTANADLVKAVQEVVDEILESNEWYGGELPGFEEEYFQRTMEDGEAIALHYPEGPDGYPVFRFAEPEQLTQPKGGDESYRFGVKTDSKDTERPLAYNIAWDESRTEEEEFDAERVTHFRRNAKRSMKRGIPDISFQTYDAFDAAAKLVDNSGDAAAQQAAIVSVMSFKTGTQSEIQAVATAGSNFTSYEPYSGQQIGVKKSRKGTTEYVPDSQSYVSGPAASNAVAHMQINMELLRCAGIRWNAPDWLISGNASGNTFSNAGEVRMSFVNTLLRQQRRTCASFQRMIWWAVEAYLEKKSIGGKSWEEIESIVKLSVEAPEPVTKDPLAEAQVAAIEIPMGVQSRQAYMQEKGRDSKQIEADNAEWVSSHDDIDPATGMKFMQDGSQDNTNSGNQKSDKGNE